MHEDSDALGLMHPDQEPRATNYISQMQGMIGRLIEKELAYQGEDGDVNFAVRLFPDYGRLSGKSLDELNAGERVAVGGGKRDPLDFVLWKSAKTGEPEDARWESNFGVGEVPAFGTLDASVSTKLKYMNSSLKIGGSNLLNKYYTTNFGSAQIGGLYYVTWTFDDLLQ